MHAFIQNSCWVVAGLSAFLAFVPAGRSSLADDILSNKFTEISPIFGSKIEGKDKFKSIIDGLYSVSLTALSFADNPAKCA